MRTIIGAIKGDTRNLDKASTLALGSGFRV